MALFSGIVSLLVDGFINAGAVDELPQQRIGTVVFGNHLIAVVGVFRRHRALTVNNLSDPLAGIIIGSLASYCYPGLFFVPSILLLAMHS